MAIGKFVTRKKRLLFTLAIVVVLGYLGINLLAYSLTYKPEACLVCHIMKPFYDNWKASGHNKVSCVDCHPYRPSTIIFSTVRYLSGNYQLPLKSHVQDKECILCHKPDTIKVVSFKETPFNHLEHIKNVKRGKALHCTSCHYALVQSKSHMEVDQNVCMLCHFFVTPAYYNQNCTVCHGEKRKDVKIGEVTFSHESFMKTGSRCIECHSQTVKGTGEVADERCRECHVERSIESRDVTRLHEIHIKKGYITCFNCHGTIEHARETTKFSRAIELACGDCHGELHESTRDMYMGIGAKGVKDEPSGMYSSRIRCTGCHTIEKTIHDDKNVSARAWEAKKTACVACHKEGYERMAEDWKKGMASFTGALQKIVDEYRKTLDQRKGPKDVLTDWDNIEYNMHFLKNGRGEHNIQYAVEIGRNILASVQQGYKRMGIAQKISPPEALAKPDGDCMFCHATYKPEKEIYIKAISTKFNHSMHVEMGTECTKCHDPKMHRLGGFIKTGCKECHPDMKL
ncbi:MAG TPA: cytochrome c3 family protein [Syntrophorhabdales bacterium]|nr:cytochrome c3 family protein [Syntrophorhabdales bacterium]